MNQVTKLSPCKDKLEATPIQNPLEDQLEQFLESEMGVDRRYWSVAGSLALRRHIFKPQASEAAVRCCTWAHELPSVKEVARAVLGTVV